MADTNGSNNPERFTNVLQGNRNLLISNIVLSEELFMLLREYKVIPVTMIEDIKNVNDREEANSILIGHVGRLGPNSFDKFCDVLGLSGHLFLSDHIRCEAVQRDPSTKRDPYDDVFRRFPSILKVLSPGEQRALSNYVREKVTDGIIKSNWKSRTAGDSKNAEDRDKRVIDTIYRDNLLKDQEAEISSLLRLVEDERVAHRKTQMNMAELEVRVHDLQVKYNEQLRIMMTSYDASERANMDSDGRLGMFDRQVKGMNVQIQKYYGMDEYAAQADASNVKISILRGNVNKILDNMIVLEKEVNTMSVQYDEERRLLFEALGLIDTGQDLKTAYLDSQAKMNSEVKRLTAEVDLLSMTFGMDSVWSLFEAEREKRSGEKEKKEKKGEGNKTKGILKKDISDFDYSHALHMIKDRLHEVHMAIEMLKRKNLEQERKIGKLEGDMDLIRLKGHMDDPNDLDTLTTPTPRSDKAPPRTLRKSQPDRSPRRVKADRGRDKSNNLPPLGESMPALQRYKSKNSGGKSARFADDDDHALKEQIDARLPPISPTGQRSPRFESDSPTSPARRNRKQNLAKERSKDAINPLHRGMPVMGLTENQAMAKMRHLDRESSYRSNRENSLKTLDFQGVLPDAGSR